MANTQDAVSTAPFVDDDADESKAYEAQDNVEAQSDIEDGSADADSLSKLVSIGNSILEALESNAQDNTETKKEGTQMANKLRRRATDDDAVLEDAQTADEVLDEVTDQGTDFDKAEDEAGKDTGSGVTVDNGDNEAGSEEDASETDALKPVTTAEAMRLADKYIKAGVIKEASRYDAISKFSKLTKVAAYNQLKALSIVDKSNRCKAAKLSKLANARRKFAETDTYEIEGTWYDMSQADMPAGVEFVSVRPNNGSVYAPAEQGGCEDILTVQGDYDTIIAWLDSLGFSDNGDPAADFVHKVARRKPIARRARRKRACELGTYSTKDGKTITLTEVDDDDAPMYEIDGDVTVGPFGTASDALAAAEKELGGELKHEASKHVSALIDNSGITRGTVTYNGKKFAWKLADQTEDANEAGKPTEGEADTLEEALEDASDAFDNAKDALEEATEKAVEKASNRRAARLRKAKANRSRKPMFASRRAKAARTSARTPRLASAPVHMDDKLALL